MSFNKLNRRNFLKTLGAAGAAFAGAGALKSRASVASGVAGRPAAQGVTADDMDRFHEEGVQVYLDNIGKDEGYWGVPLNPTMDGDVKVFQVVAIEAPWDTGGGNTVNAMMYNGMVPGPYIRVTEGEQVRIVFTNSMTQSSSIHFHGVHTPNSMDGVPYVTQPVVKPGETFNYEFTARNAGTHMYHSHHNAAEQVSRGLMGAFIIDPADASSEPEVSADYIMMLNDSSIGLTLNGRGFPYTQPIIAAKGDVIRVRYMNEGMMIHPMHLHGMYQEVISKDGAKLPMPYLADTLNVAPGERYDVIVRCEEPGVWAFHCHVLSHAESSHGMFGMVTALVINE